MSYKSDVIRKNDHHANISFQKRNTNKLKTDCVHLLQILQSIANIEDNNNYLKIRYPAAKINQSVDGRSSAIPVNTMVLSSMTC